MESKASDHGISHDCYGSRFYRHAKYSSGTDLPRRGVDRTCYCILLLHQDMSGRAVGQEKCGGATAL